MFGQIIILKFFFFVIQLTFIINSIKSQDICLDNSVLTCYCHDDTEYVSCIGKNETNDTFVDWTTFASSGTHQDSFTFTNLTHLTSLTFTNFSSRFHSISYLKLTFIDGIDEIDENTFQEFNYYSHIPFDLIFNSPRNFQLADYAFGQAKYSDIVINGIQYSQIHNLSYKFNLKSMYNTTIDQMFILDSGEMDFISNQTSTIKLYQHLTIFNCSLTNASHLIDAISSSLVDLDLSSNNLIEIPSMIKFEEMKRIELHHNLIEEVKSNTFSNMMNLVQLDLSNNRIKQIAFDAFIGMSLTRLDLSNNLLTITSFLYPLNQSMTYLTLSNNFIDDLDPLKEMSNLDTLIICCNQIKQLDKFVFNKANSLRTIDLSYNQIEFIHPMAFNGTSVSVLNLAGNSLSSLEVNQTSSFLYSIASTIVTLSFANCTNLSEINWFVITKLRVLYNLDLSGIPKTDQFWSYREMDNNSIIHWFYPPGPHIFLHDIQFTDNDYCLSKSIAHILRQTTLVIDINHACNCFIFKYKDLFDSQKHPSCLSNDSIMEELSRRCADIDLFCESLSNDTTTFPITEWTSSSSVIDSSEMTQTNTITSFMSTSTLTPAITSTEKRTEQSSISSTIRLNTTTTHNSSSAPGTNQQSKIILATTLSSIFIIIILSLMGVLIFKERKKKNSTENLEMHKKILNKTDEE